jgi:hypothetical protein
MSKNKDRISIRLSEADMSGLKKIQLSGEFEEMSSALRWCIHFTVAMLRIIPLAVIEGFMRTEEGDTNDQMEEPAKEVQFT